MSVSVPTMNAACALPRSLMGYDSSLVAPTSPHHSAWGCAPMSQVKQEPADHDSSSTSGVSSMAHGSFLSVSNTSPSSGSSMAGSMAGSPRYTAPRASPDPLQALHGMSQSTPLAPQRTSPAPAPVPAPVPASSPRLDAASQQHKVPVPRTPGSVDDNSRSSSCSNSEDDGDDHMRRLQSHIASASYCTDSRDKLSSHYDLKCSLCEFSAGSADTLRAHLREAHDLALSPDQEDPADNGYLDDQDDGVSTPKVNSQGKVKTFRCKQCEFVAVTKLDFWEHTKLHIKQEKLLTCPKCPFVTEYKHHLEYHLRNHFNSKPFKCDKCSYSCVNKSMLNSHLKSHSNVYQYRCADCTYATKYCHSLKLHLRKYGHQPSMVLNPDGTPNPLPIIDVYGTRRGPKTKTSKAAQAALQQQQQQQQMTFPHGIFPPPYGLAPIFPYAPQDLPLPQPQAGQARPSQGSPQLQRCTYCDFTTADADLLAQHVFVHAESNLMQYFQANNNNNNYNGQEGIKEYLSKVIAPVAPASPPRQATPPRQASPPSHPSPASPASATTPARPLEPTPTPRPAGAPLDLSKPEGLSEDGGSGQGQTKNRRKGRAFKLERIAMRLQQQSSGDEADDVPIPAKAPRLSPERHQEQPAITRSPSPPKSQSPATSVSAKDESYNCTYCDISFRDIVMYTMHMGYHGYQDPFQCNMCGHQTSDKVSFFLHIARSSHS